MTAKPPERSRDLSDDLDYREPWDQAGSTPSTGNQGNSSKEFHFREAGMQRFNDVYDWDDDDH